MGLCIHRNHEGLLGTKKCVCVCVCGFWRTTSSFFWILFFPLPLCRRSVVTHLVSESCSFRYRLEYCEHLAHSHGEVSRMIDRSSLSSRRTHSGVRGQLHATTKRISTDERDASGDVISYIFVSHHVISLRPRDTCGISAGSLDAVTMLIRCSVIHARKRNSIC